MKRFYIIAATTLMVAFELNAQVHTITQSGFSFNPQTLSVSVGDTIRWQWTGGSHTTTSIDVPDGAAEWESPLNNTTQQFEYIVTVAGTYDYVCVPHQGMGMTGSFTAGASTGVNSTFSDALLPAQSPFSDRLIIRTESETPVPFIVYDLTGKIRLRSLAGGQTTIHTESWPDGMYILEIRKPGMKPVKQKLIKKS